SGGIDPRSVEHQDDRGARNLEHDRLEIRSGALGGHPQSVLNMASFRCRAIDQHHVGAVIGSEAREELPVAALATPFALHALSEGGRYLPDQANLPRSGDGLHQPWDALACQLEQRNVAGRGRIGPSDEHAARAVTPKAWRILVAWAGGNGDAIRGPALTDR